MSSIRWRKTKTNYFAEQKLVGRAQIKAMAKIQQDAIDPAQALQPGPCRSRCETL